MRDTSAAVYKPAEPDKPKIQTGSWVWDRDLQCLVPKHGRNYFEHDDKRSDLPSPHVIGGGMPAVKSMADGRVYETKRNYEKSVARAGCEIVGFDKRWQEHVKSPKPFGTEREHEADLVHDTKKAIEIEQSKLPPTNGLECRRVARKQKRAARASK
jgi:hypothetical protein